MKFGSAIVAIFFFGGAVIFFATGSPPWEWILWFIVGCLWTYSFLTQ